MDKFIKDIKEVVETFAVKLQQFPKAIMTRNEWANYNKSKKCWICHEDFSQKTIKSKAGNDWKPKQKVVDHCHITGKYLGAAHSDCNFKRQNERVIPVFIHNLSGYDSHMIVKALNQFADGILKIIYQELKKNTSHFLRSMKQKMENCMK